MWTVVISFVGFEVCYGGVLLVWCLGMVCCCLVGCFEVFGGEFVVLSVVDLVFVDHQAVVCLFMFYCHMVWFTFVCRML